MRRGLARIAATAAVILLSSTTATWATSYAGSVPDSARPSGRVLELVDRMTLDEKLSFVHWTYNTEDPLGKVFLPGVPRLGIPEMRATDGPAGVTIHRPALAMPAPIALASTFDEGLAAEYGKVLGREGRAFGQDVIFAPMVNNIRVPHAGRNFETFSEDPLVTSRIAASEVKGIQSQGLMATVKHYAANTQETNRMSADVRVGERVLHEIEMPGFEGAVRAGAASAMCAYPKVNGQHACGNGYLLENVLRAQLDFQGWVMSDWLATHSTKSLVRGLDQELGIEANGAPPPGSDVPEGKYFGPALRAAIEQGRIPEAELDESVTRILGQMERFGLLDEQPPPRPGRDVHGGTRVAKEVAESGAVLLRNEEEMLPLDDAPGQDIAMIGPTAKTPKVTGLGSSYVEPDSATSPLKAVRDRLGGRAEASYSVGEELEGEPIPDSALEPPFPSGEVLPPAGDGVIYEGELTVDRAGLYRIAARTNGDLATIEIGDRKPITAGEVFGKLTSAPVQLDKGKHKIRITGTSKADEPMTLDFNWVTPERAKESIDRAVAEARRANTAVVFAFDNGSESEDRSSLGLPGRQDELISKVAEANPNTVVVLNTGSSVTMPWLERTRAVLDMWYPGQAGAEATTALLFGDANPSGRLTQSFPVSEEETPVAGDPARFPGVDGKVHYSEGLFSGYRWYDQQGVTPLFPFGHGLSYTSFAYEQPRIRRTQDGVDVSLTVRNTGQRAGAEVVQTYLGASPRVQRPQPERELAGFTKIRLRPGESRRVRVAIDERALQHWNPEKDSWELGGGERAVEIGSSSARIKLRGHVQADPLD